MGRKFGIEIEVIGGEVTPTAAARLITQAGVECKFETYNHDRRTYWKIVSDGSLSGRNAFEIVSPPLKGDKGLRDARIVAQAIRAAGINVNRSCGLHVHVDARDMQDVHFKNLCKLVTIHEAHFKRVLPESRHSNGYAQFPSATFPGLTVDQICDRINHCDTFASLRRLWANRDDISFGGGSARYRAINLESMARHGTVEFRAHSGTVDADKMIAWASLCIGLVRRAMVSEVVGPRWANGRKRNWQDFIRGAGKEHMEFFLKRWEELGGNTAKVYASREARKAQLEKQGDE